MLEVVFGESAAGGLAVAQHCGEDDIGGAFGVCILSEDGSDPSPEELEEARNRAEKEECIRHQNAVSIGGNRDDIFCFSNDLSRGDISGNCVSENRLNYLEKFRPIFPDECDCYVENVKKAKKNLDILVERASAGEILRIWYSEQPVEYCGLCWLISELKNRMKNLPRIRVIKQPNQVEKGNTICHYMGWGGVCPEEFHQFLSLEKEATPAFVTGAIIQWKKMQDQNAPLRAVINGTLQSVPEDFYDCFIKREISLAEHEFHEAHLIGNILGKYQLGIGDVWVAFRIEKMIEKGWLSPTTQPNPGDGIYRRMLKKNV